MNTAAYEIGPERSRVASDLFSTPLEQYRTPDLTEEDQLNNAHLISGGLRGFLWGLAGRTSEAVQERAQSKEEPRAAWLGDISRTLIRGERLTIEPGVSFANDFEAERLGRASMIKQEHSLALTGLLRAIAPIHQPTSPNNRQVALVTMAHNTYRSLRGLDPRLVAMYQRNHIVSTAELLREQGALRKHDIPGQDYSIIGTEQFQHRKPGGIIEQLRQSEWGELISTGNGEALAFRPNEALREIVPLRDPIYDDAQPITVRWPGGHERRNALHAQALQNILQGQSSNHLTIANPTQYGYYQSVFTLLRAVDGIQQHNWHTVTEREYRDHNSGHPREVNPIEFVYSVGTQLQDHVQRFIDSRNMFESFKNFDPYEYTARNYGKAEALKDDQDICRVVSFALTNLDIHDADVVDVGSGPNPYPAGLLLPFAKSIELLEYAEPNRDYMQAYLNRTLSPESASIWPKFERHMQEGGGYTYEGVFTRLQQAAQEGRVTVKYGDIFQLPKKKWRIASQYFVDDSISIYRSDYREAVASMCSAIEDEGLVISGNMLNDKDHVGYNAGEGRVFPNISQNATELKQAYTDNDMYSLVIPVGDTRKAREGYYGMVITLAAKRNSAMRHKLEAVKVQLEDMGYTVL